MFSAPRLGFEIMPSGNGTGDSMEIMEGETKQVCVVLVEPEGCELFMRVDVRLSENSPDTNGELMIKTKGCNYISLSLFLQV